MKNKAELRVVGKILTLAAGAAIGAVAFSAAAQSTGNSCDGRVFNGGSGSGACYCSQGSHPDQFPDVPNCHGPVVVINDYYSCGGNTTLTCDTTTQKVGASTPCTFQWLDPAGYTSDFEDWLICQCGGSPPNICNYGTCAQDSSSATDIKRSVYIGSDGECGIACVREAPLEDKVSFLLALCSGLPVEDGRHV